MGVLLQIYACPIYETMDTAWGRKQEGTWSIFNFSERFITRVIYLVLTTFVAALLPFFVSATLYIAYFVSSLPPPSPPSPPPSSPNIFQPLGVPPVCMMQAVKLQTWLAPTFAYVLSCTICSYTLSLSVAVLVAATM